MNKTQYKNNITSLFYALNNNTNCIGHLTFTSIVANKVYSHFGSYPRIKSAVFTGVEGDYRTENGFPGHSHYEDISQNGLVINFEGSQQLFVPESSKIEVDELEGNIRFDIKDNRSSMYIQIQILTETKNM